MAAHARMANNQKSGRLQRLLCFCTQNLTKYTISYLNKSLYMVQQSDFRTKTDKRVNSIKNYPLCSLNLHRQTSATYALFSLLSSSSQCCSRSSAAPTSCHWLCPSELDVRKIKSPGRQAPCSFILCWNKLIGKATTFISDVCSCCVLGGRHTFNSDLEEDNNPSACHES